jgi:hypothetical protein
MHQSRPLLGLKPRLRKYAVSRNGLLAISANYPSPVTVNGFQCRNCTDVENAKKHIDPQHPKSGPYNIDAKTDPTRQTSVILSGALSGLNSVTSSTSAQSASNGDLFDLSA